MSSLDGIPIAGAVNWTNETVTVDAGAPLIKKIHDGVVVGILVVIMFSMGCHIRVSELLAHLKRPVGILVGMLSQFILLPLLSYGLLSALKLSGVYAVGMLILSCCPGGATSNVFAYFCDGDVPLSIVMTMCSTVLAMGMMPLNILLYGQFIDTGNVIIPYQKIATSMFVVTIPACFGLLFNWKFPKLSPYITKVGSVLGFLLIVVAQTMEVFIFPDIFRTAPAAIYLAVVLLPAFGIFVGYLFSWALKRPDPVRRTIAIESGVQNIGTAITVIALSFKYEVQKAALTFPLLYGFSMVILCFIVSSSYQLCRRTCCRDEKGIDLAPPVNLISNDLAGKFKPNPEPVWAIGVDNPVLENRV